MVESDSRGRFVWYELMTTDPAAAQRFYTDVVGWGTTPFEDAPMPYTMWTKGESPDSMIGGVAELPAEARSGGVLPHWMAYVAVPDVDRTAARVEKLGGRILMGPDDIPNVGRFVLFADPQGATMSAFRSSTGTPMPEREAEPGDVSWHELATTDPDAAFDFYAELFGWEKTEAMDMGEAGTYQMFGRSGRPVGGVFRKPAEMPGPPAWLYYVKVADLDAALGKVGKRGGKVLNGPMDVPGGRIAQCMDPQGAAFALHETIAS